MAPFSSDGRPAGARAVGSVLAGCGIEAVVHVGPVCTVYRAGDALGGGRYALKEYCPQALCVRGEDGAPRLHDPHDAVARAAFEAGRNACLEELRLLSRLRLPGLVTVLQASEGQGSLCGLMPWLPGVPLDALPPPRGGEDVRELLLALLEPLAQLHAAGLVHGGLHARQLLWAAGQRPVLLGFGSAARALGLPEVFRCAPPELRPEGAHLPRGPWTDLYMLAATVLGHLGAWTWSGVPSGDDVAAALVQALPPPAGPAHRLLAQALQACLRASPTERPAGAVALRAMLGDGVPGPQPLRPATTGGGRAPPAERANPRPMAGLAAGVSPAAGAPATAPLSRGAPPVQPPATRAAVREGAGSPARTERGAPPESAGAPAPAARAAPDPALAAVPDGRPDVVPPAPRRHRVTGPVAAALLVLGLGAGWAAWWGQGWWQAEQERRHMDQLLSEAAARAQAPASPAAPASAGVPAVLGLGVPPPLSSQAPVPDGPTAAVPPATAPVPPTAGGAGPPGTRADTAAGGAAVAPVPAAPVEPAPAARAQPRPREVPPPAARPPTPVARAAELPDAPLSACVAQAKSGLDRCMRQQCAKPAWRRHVQCERWLEGPDAPR